MPRMDYVKRLLLLTSLNPVRRRSGWHKPVFARFMPVLHGLFVPARKPVDRPMKRVSGIVAEGEARSVRSGLQRRLDYMTKREFW